MSVIVPVLRESEHAIEALRTAQGELWAERLADMLARLARLDTPCRTDDDTPEVHIV